MLRPNAAPATSDLQQPALCRGSALLMLTTRVGWNDAVGAGQFRVDDPSSIREPKAQGP
jgi:hypothetical protein